MCIFHITLFLGAVIDLTRSSMLSSFSSAKFRLGPALGGGGMGGGVGILLPLAAASASSTMLPAVVLLGRVVVVVAVAVVVVVLSALSLSPLATEGARVL